MLNYFLAFYACFAFAVNFTVIKFYQKHFATGLKSTLLFPVINSLAMTIFPLFLNGFKLQINKFALLLALLLATVIVVHNIINIFAYKYGKVSIFSMFLMLGGMLLPYLYGIIFFRETPSTFAITGMAILTVSLFVPLIEKKKSNRITLIFLLLCLCVFILNGMNGVVSVIHQKSSSAIDTNSFLIWSGIFQFSISLPVYLSYVLYMKLKKTPIKPSEQITEDQISEEQTPALVDMNRTELAFSKMKPVYRTFISIIVVLIAALISCTGSLAQLTAAKSMDSSVLYPIVTGGMIVLMSLSGTIIYKEKLTTSIIIGVILSFAGAVLFTL